MLGILLLTGHDHLLLLTFYSKNLMHFGNTYKSLMKRKQKHKQHKL